MGAYMDGVRKLTFAGWVRFIWNWVKYIATWAFWLAMVGVALIYGNNTAGVWGIFGALAVVLLVLYIATNDDGLERIFNLIGAIFWGAILVGFWLAIIAGGIIAIGRLFAIGFHMG